MKRLIVLRHAKSSWKSGAPDDHARPLNKRGRRDAPRVAARLAELGWTPERVISSDAKRTRQTWARMEDALGEAAEVVFTRELYMAGVNEVREALAALPDEVATAMVIGHNPGWEEVVAWLCGEETRMTTANAALLVGEGESWEEALGAPGTWELERVVRPKELDDD